MDVDLVFPSAVARGSHPEFLNDSRIVLTEYLSRVQPNTWNVCQSEAMFDARLDGLLALIAKESFVMLSEQGYDMSQSLTRVSEFWGQEFMKTGQHIEHIHARGVQITGFYFVDVPENSSYPAIFDPRYGKRQINLPQASMDSVTYASEQIYFAIKPGDLMLFNSWLPHGFTRHESDSPLRFIHFNVNVEQNHVCQAEVI
jgi:uncharacterized protein (TIGR02466 family)